MDAAVERVADDRMADRAQVHANLVRAAGVNRDLRQRQRRVELLGADDARHRLAAAPRARRHLLPVGRIAADRRVDPASRLHHAPDQRDVFLLDLAIVKLPRELLVRGVVLGDDHQPRRAAIEPMHDARPLFAADAAQIVDVMEQRVDERAARVARGGMHDHPGRLVDDDRGRDPDRGSAAAAPRPAAAASTGSGTSTTTVCPALTGWFGFAARPSTRTWPSLISR